ncbi:ferritin-like domain-containing protein [Desulfatitalea alkaliphila]|uniref:Ferritin family protein n=1 Tax=Desulfatitalea alkaliphila TaxID=2929485 RepID=A0AA41R1Y5_9BACT|nr:ferritin family protein [Desulfatitalea alkaliphila]MCJ8500544.1 ferritin family protein [Desulfatitalea alkaliphila]
MFTKEDICDIAIQIERNGEAAYRRASREATDPEVARLLAAMADQERDHAHWFEHLDPACRADVPKSRLAAMGRELLQNIMAQQTFSLDPQRLADASDLAEVLAQSIEFENDTVLFYEMLHDFLDDQQVMTQLEGIIQEERNHIVQLKEMAAKVGAVQHSAD